MSDPIELPQHPKGSQFEHLAFAYLSCAGFYLDRNLEERTKGEQILELDALATLFTNTECLSTLVECKSGAFGFRDMFTVLGWMTYMNVPRGLLVSTEHAPPAKDAIFLKKAKDQGIDLLSCSSDAEAESAFVTAYGTAAFDSRYVSLWRYSLWLESVLLRRLKKLKKSVHDARRFKALEEYYQRVSSDIFFSTNLLERIGALYDTYRMRPNITSHVGVEMAGGDFNAETDGIPADLFRETFFGCANNELQTSLFIEHRARIAIMRTAIEYRILMDTGVDDERTKAEYMFLGFSSDRYGDLPHNFRVGIDKLAAQPYFHLYPRFWQFFYYILGAFILEDRHDDEYALLSRHTGIPVQSIDQAIHAYDDLFPTSGGWFELNAYSNIRQMKMASIPFRGIGAFARLLEYSPDRKYSSVGLGSAYATKDLAKWHNLVYEILSAASS